MMPKREHEHKITTDVNIAEDFSKKENENSTWGTGKHI